MHYPKRFARFNEVIAQIAGGIILLIGLLSVISAIARGIFNEPISWTFDVNQYLLIWTIFLAAGYGFQAHGHVKVDILTRILKKKIQRVLALVANITCIAFVISFLRTTIIMFMTAYGANTMTYASIPIPRWILIVPMLIGCVIMIICLVSIITDVLGKNDEYL